MEYIECPQVYKGDKKSLFLAGGISNCPDWQSQIVQLFSKSSLQIALLNPRRKKFDVTNNKLTEEQIVWEYNHLQKADAILFWFPSGDSLCPITLFELGAHLYKSPKKPLFVGCGTKYPRRLDVIIQTRLIRPEIKVVDSIDALVQQVIEHFT